MNVYVTTKVPYEIGITFILDAKYKEASGNEVNLICHVKISRTI